MALLEYLNHTVPDVIPKSVKSFFYRDPLMEAALKRNRVIRHGGSQVRFKRIKSGHSDISEINAANLSVSLAKRETFDTMTGDWGRYIKPIVLPHIDLDRMQSKEMKKRFIKETVDAVIVSYRNAFCRRIYLGNNATVSGRDAMAMIGSLNGGLSATPGNNGTANGFVNGGLEFDTPATQNTAGNTYMNLARRNDTVYDEDNWYNQCVLNTGIGTDFLDAAEEIKMRADSYAEDDEGITLGILGHAEHVALGQEIRSVSATTGIGLVYTPADLEKGRGHKVIHIAGGITYHSNRYLTAANLAVNGGGPISDAAYLLNANGVEIWFNAGNDFRLTPFIDMLETSNHDADVAKCILETQFVLRELLVHGCTRS